MMSRAPSQSSAALFKPCLLAPASGSKTAACSMARSHNFLPRLASPRPLARHRLRTLPSAVAVDADAPILPPPAPTEEAPSPAVTEAEETKESTMSRVYDASVLGEPEAVTEKEARRRVWEKLAAARVVYLGEAEVAPDPDDRALEL
jgi:hypothetical protein